MNLHLHSRFEKYITRPCQQLLEPLLGRTKVFRYHNFDFAYERFGVRRKKLKNRGWIYELEVADLIVSELSKHGSPVFLDIGSHIGFMSLNILNALNRTTIYAFEPGERQRELFRETIRLNNLENKITLTGSALGEKIEEATFVYQRKWPEADYSMGDGFLNTGRWTKATEKKVQVSTLDSWWSSTGKSPVHVVKMDTEGAELLVLRGGREFVIECKPVFVLEINQLNLRVYPYDEKDILSFFKESDYGVYTLAGEPVNEDSINGFMRDNEMFLAKPNSAPRTNA